MKQEQWNEALNHIDISLIEEYVEQDERLDVKKDVSTVRHGQNSRAPFKKKRLLSLIAAILIFGVVLSLSMMWIADRDDPFGDETTPPFGANASTQADTNTPSTDKRPQSSTTVTPTTEPTEPPYSSIVLPNFSHISLNKTDAELVKYAAYCWEEQLGEELVWLNGIMAAGVTCYGVYGDTAVFFAATENETRTRVKVGDYSYWYDCYFELHAFHDGAFLPITAAYEQGLLNDQDLYSIYYTHGKNVSALDLSRIKELPKLWYIMLDSEIDRIVRVKLSEESASDTPEEISYRCITVFGDTCVLYWDNGMAGFMMTYEEVGGYWFAYPDTNTLRILSNGELYSMAEAYKKGVITLSQVAYLRDIYSPIRYQ